MRFCLLEDVPDDVRNNVPAALLEFYTQIIGDTPQEPAAVAAVTADVDLTAIFESLPGVNLLADLSLCLDLLKKFHRVIKISRQIVYEDTKNFWTGASFPKTQQAQALKVQQFLPLVRTLLAIPATSSTSERVFSAASFIENKRRTVLSRQRVEELVVLKYTAKDNPAFAQRFQDSYAAFKAMGCPKAKRNPNAQEPEPVPPPPADGDDGDNGDNGDNGAEDAAPGASADDDVEMVDGESLVIVDGGLFWET